MDKVRAGLNTTFGPPQGFGPPGGRGGPGGGMGAPAFIGAAGKRNGLASMMGIEFPSVHADLEFDGALLPDTAVRYKGNGTFVQSRQSLKRSLKLDLNDFVPGRKLGGVAKLNLHNNVTDASWMNEVMSHRLFRDAGVAASRTAYARVYVTVPGKHTNEYLGLYSIVENVDNNFLRDRFGTRKGALFKPVPPKPFEDIGDDWSAYQQAYDPKTPVSDEETRQVIAFCKLVSHADDATFAARLEEYLDLDQFARFMTVTTWLSTMDSILALGQNYLVYLDPKTRKFLFFPWDLDHSFGQFGMVGTQEQRENLSIHKPWRGEIRLLERVFKVDAFKRIYLARFREFSQTIFKPERLCQEVDQIAAAIRPAIQEESAEKLARFDRVVAGEAVEPAGFGGGLGGPRPQSNRPEILPFGGGGGAGGGPPNGPSAGGPAASGGPRFGPPGFMQPPKPIKGFVKARASSVADQLDGKSKGQALAEFGFGSPGGRGGPGGPGGPGGFGPGMFLGGVFVSALDADKDGTITREEFSQGFAKWFTGWNTDQSGVLVDEQLRAGIDKDLSPFRGGPPGGPGFGPPGGPVF